MELKILCKHLVANELNGKFTVGENNADTVGITLPRFYGQHDLSQFYFKITAAGKCKNAAIQMLEMDRFDEENIHLLWKVTSDFTSIPEEFTLILTGVNSDNSVTIKFESCPIIVNPDKSWEFAPSPELSEQLLNQVQAELKNTLETVDKKISEYEITPATAEKTGGVKSGKDISVSGEGLVTVNSVNGKTLGKSVPADAVFTDTVYNDTDINNRLSEIISYLGYTDDIIGLHADFENNIFTRLAGAVGKSAGADFDVFPMYGGRKRCNVLDDGTITAYYCDDDFAEDGSNGQVMVYQPKFYYKVVPIKLDLQTDGYGYHLRSANYYISAVPKSGFKLHPAFYNEDGNPVDYILFSAYEGSIFDTSANTYLQNDEQVADFSTDKLSSVLGVKPCSGTSQNLTRYNAEQLAKKRGSGWHCDTIKTESANQLLMIIEYAAFDIQNIIGKGVVNSHQIAATGATSYLGNISGIANGENNKNSVSYRGVENLWGNIWKFINGINIYGNGSMNGGISYICTDFDFSENKINDNYKSSMFTISNEGGFISSFGYSSEFDWLFLPSETITNNDSPINDYTWLTANMNGYKTVLFSGDLHGEYRAGIFCYGMHSNVNNRGDNIGCRLIFIPQST